MTTLPEAWRRLSAGRRVHGIAAALLPYRDDGTIDWRGFEAHVVRTRAAGLDVAVNMDTGFGDVLTPAHRTAVLDATRTALGEHAHFYAGAYAAHGDYRQSIEAIGARGGVPVIVQHAAMAAMEPIDLVATYRQAVELAEEALAFELSPVFAPHGSIWPDAVFTGLVEIDRLRGAKHSSLDRAIELRRLAARDAARPDFRIYTGNDLAIDMVAYGSDYLLGLATFAPEAFAARDEALAAGDATFLARNDALQHLGNVAFRAPVPAYKHAAALFLHLTGHLDGDAVHPAAPRRLQTDRVLLFDCALRLGLLDDPDRIWAERVAPYV